jgi:DNA polymerase
MIFNDSQLDLLAPREEGTPRERLALLAEGAARCTACRYNKNRKTSVFGSGNSSAKLLLVSEAPGRNENRKGLPFVGKAGDVLDKILGGLKLSRKQIYICNIIKCWPGDGNPDPSMTCIKQCRHFLVKQIDIIKPKVIVAAGNFALKGLFGTNYAGITKEVGVERPYLGIPVIPVLHPAAFLRDKDAGILREWKKSTWEAWKHALEIAQRGL